MSSFLIFILGACLGSFSNVCIYRLPKSKQIVSGRSFCPRCKKYINWFDNLPLISFLFLNGKCRKCKKAIPLRYFIVEIITGIIFLLVYLNHNDFSTIIFLSTLSLIYIIIFFIDLENFIIPDSLNFSVMAIALFKNFLPNFNTSFIHEINQSIIGGMVGYLSIWLIIYFYKVIKKIEGMGMGDAKLMAGIGLLFELAISSFYTFCISNSWSNICASIFNNKKKNMRSEIPFGPFIIAACLIYFTYGDFLYSLILV